MKIQYEELDRVRAKIEYVRIDENNKTVHYHHEAVGTVVEHVGKTGQIKIDFKAHDGISEIRLFNAMHLLPVIDVYEYTMKQQRTELERSKKIIEKIKSAIEETI